MDEPQAWSAGKASDVIYTDLPAQNPTFRRIDELAPTQMHRPVDLAIVEADQEGIVIQILIIHLVKLILYRIHQIVHHYTFHYMGFGNWTPRRSWNPKSKVDADPHSNQASTCAQGSGRCWGG